MTHDDLQPPGAGNTRKYPENPRYFRVFYPGFLPFSACWPLNNSNTTVTTVTNSNSMGWGEHLNNVKDFSQH